MNLFYRYTNSRYSRGGVTHEIWQCKNHSFQKIRGGYIWKSGQAKKYAFRKFLGGGGGVRLIWINPDMTGFSLMTASLSLIKDSWLETNKQQQFIEMITILV